MNRYERSEFPELSAIKINDGTIYHLKGAYQIDQRERVILPVNRSYAPDTNGNREQTPTHVRYRKHKLIHEEAKDGSVISDGELLLKVYGKPLLFLNKVQVATWYSSRYEENPAVSAASRKIADHIKESLLRLRTAQDFRIGVYGSHQPSLHGVDSDLDLIAWVGWDKKSEFIEAITKIFRQLGYKNSGETGKDAEYATRYSKRLGVSDLAGWYLAHKRFRWTSPDGISTSLQCLNVDYDHKPAEKFLAGIDNSWDSEEILCDCRVISASCSYNFPKFWKVEWNGKLINVVSFSWTHQGMGDDNDVFSKQYLFKGSKVTNSYGEFLYLKDENHYLLPKDLL